MAGTVVLAVAFLAFASHTHGSLDANAVDGVRHCSCAVTHAGVVPATACLSAVPPTAIGFIETDPSSVFEDAFECLLPARAPPVLG